MNKKIMFAVGIVVVVGIGIFLGIGGPQNKEVKNDNPPQNFEKRLEIASSTDTKGAVTDQKSFTLKDVVTHNTPQSCYTMVNGSIYDLTAWISQHPGGEEAIIKLCGTDGTAAFTKKHGMNEKAKATLEGFKIGTLFQ